MSYSSLLNDAYDIHVHSSPDVIPRSQDFITILTEAKRAKMAGMLLKSHTTSTVGRVYALNQCENSPFKFFSSLCLNPSVGDLNTSAVVAAIGEGVDFVFFPTYGARHHISTWGAGKPPTAFPFSSVGPVGTYILDRDGTLKRECCQIVNMIASHDKILATGHISPEEALVLIKTAKASGCNKMIVTHASESVTCMDLLQQKEAVEMGAFIEHCFFAVTPSCPDAILIEEIKEQIRYVGVEHCILSSDFGQSANLPPVEGFGYYLDKMKQVGFSEDEIRQMVHDNPREILGEGESD